MIFTNGLRNGEGFAETLTSLTNAYDEACFVTAFFTQDQLIKMMCNANKKVRLVVSLRPPTCPKALRRVQLLNNADVRFMGRELHSKIYAFSKGERDSLFGAEFEGFIGSSNMTDGGLFNNIETNILLSGKQAEQLFNDAEAIFERSEKLTAEVLNRYEEEFSSYEKPIFNDIISSPEKLGAGYERIHNAVKYVSNLCKEEIESHYPNVPPSFVVDHFWHFIVEVKKHEKDSIRLRTLENLDDQLIKSLFNEYVQWEKSVSPYCHEMVERANELKRLLALKRTLTANELERIFLTFHSSRYTDERYKGKAEAFRTKNSAARIVESLRYLANEEIPIAERVAALQKKPMHLSGFGESAVKEFNGWCYPSKYPIWNTKSDRALEILGFG